MNFKKHIYFFKIILFTTLFYFPVFLFSQKPNNNSNSALIIKDKLRKVKLLPKDSTTLSEKLLKEALALSKNNDKDIYLPEIYIALGQIYIKNQNIEEAIVNFNSGLLLAEKYNNDSLQGIALSNLGIINGRLNNTELAIKYFSGLLELGEKSNNLKTKAKAYNNLGVINENLGNLLEALDFYQKALKTWNDLNDTLMISGCYNNIGNTYYRIGDFNKALDYHFNALKLRKAANNKPLIANSYNNIGSIYEVLKNYDKALEYHLASLQIKKEYDDQPSGFANSYNNIGNIYRDFEYYDTALMYYNKALKIWQKQKNKKAISMLLHNMAGVYHNTDSIQDAIKLYLEATKIEKEISAYYDLATTYNSLASLYYELGKYKDALKYLFEANEIEKQIKSLDLQSNTLKLLAESYLKLNDYKNASLYYNQLTSIRDSLYELNKASEIEKLTLKNKRKESKEKENANPDIGLKNISDLLRINSGIFLLIILALAILLLFAIFLIARLYKTKKLQVLSEQTTAWFYAILEATNDGIIIFDEKGKLFTYNEKFIKIWQLNEEGNLKSNSPGRFDEMLLKLSNETDFKNEITRLTDISLEKHHHILELTDGKSFEMYSLVFSLRGLKKGTMWSFRDLTERKKAINAIKISQHRYQTVVERSLNGIAILQDFKAKFVNNALVNYSGYTKEELLKQPFDKLIPPDKLEEIKNRFYARLRGEDVPSRYELGLLNKQNKLIYFEVDASIIEYEGKPAVLGFFRDITKRKIVEDELRKLSSAVEYSPLSVVITDYDGNIEYVNPMFTKLTGYTLGEVFGKNPSVLKSGEQPNEFYSNLWQTIKSGNTWIGEFHNKKKNGELYWEEASISPISSNGNITHFVALKNNITELKKAHDELIIKEKKLKDLIATKDKFFSIVAHDLKNPFHTLMGFTELILSNPKKFSPEKITEYIELISRTAKSGYNLLDNLLQWARSQTGRLKYSPEKFKIREIIDEIVQLNQTGIANKKLKVLISLNDNLICFADKNTINTVFRNLISNAIKYSKPGSSIEISSSIINNFIQIAIKDNGVGIKKEDLNKLFKIDVNYSTLGTNDEKGTGLGLILCKDFIENNGGNIWVESEEGKGSTFFVTIPIN